MIQGLQRGGSMGRKPRVDRSPEEKRQIIQEGIKSGNVSETCRRHGIAPNLFHRWKDEAEQGAKAALDLYKPLTRSSLAPEVLWHAVYFFALHGDAGAAWHHASPHRVSSSGRQQLHRTVPTQLAGRGSLDLGISQSRRVERNIGRYLE